MDEQTKEDIRRMTAALTDQKTIQQLSESGKAAKMKRDELERKRKEREAAEKKEPEKK